MDLPQATPYILVIDDEPAIREVMGELLCDAGYRVTTHPDFFNQLDHLLELHPDLIVMDIIMQGKRTGIEFLKTLKADPRTARIPVAVCTGAAHLTAEINDVLESWDCQLICKPFDIDEFTSEITHCLTENRLNEKLINSA